MSIESDLNKVFDLFSKLKVSPDVCEVFDDQDFKDIKIKKKSSASDSEVLFATYVKASSKKDANVAMKVWLSLDELSTKEITQFRRNKDKMTDKELRDSLSGTLSYIDFLRGLTYETKLYKFISDQIISHNLSPNFIPYLAFGSCNLKTLKNKMDVLLGPNEQLTKFFKPLSVFPNLKLNILVTGTHSGTMKSMLELLNEDANDTYSPALTDEDRLAIIFQSMYTLLLLEYFKINHNDLHMGNILVQKLDAPVCLKFNIGKNSVAFSTMYEPKFYDWDRGFQETLGKNPALSEFFSIETHTVNSFAKNRDYYQFICSLKMYPKFFNLISPLLPHPEYNEWQYKGESGTQKDMKLSSKSLQKLLKFLAENPTAIENKILGRGLYFVILKSELKNLFTASEISRLGSAQRLKFSEKVFLLLNEDKTSVSILPGWNCQPLYPPSDDLLYPLMTLFTDENLWQALTSGLKKCSKVSKQKTYTFP